MHTGTDMPTLRNFVFSRIISHFKISFLLQVSSSEQECSKMSNAKGNLLKFILQIYFNTFFAMTNNCH